MLRSVVFSLPLSHRILLLTLLVFIKVTFWCDNAEFDLSIGNNWETSKWRRKEQCEGKTVFNFWTPIYEVDNENNLLFGVHRKFRPKTSLCLTQSISFVEALLLHFKDIFMVSIRYYLTCQYSFEVCWYLSHYLCRFKKDLRSNSIWMSHFQWSK